MFALDRAFFLYKTFLAMSDNMNIPKMYTAINDQNDSDFYIKKKHMHTF